MIASRRHVAVLEQMEHLRDTKIAMLRNLFHENFDEFRE